MRWIVGIDLLERSQGAMNMAAWMRTHRRPDVDEDFVALHVLDDATRGWVRDDLVDDIVDRADQALHRAIEATGIASPFGDVRVAIASTAEDGLAEAATTGVDGILIGRAAPREARALTRLGSVARRMLRRLPVPTMVVPPDLERTAIGKGGIVLATDLAPRSLAAAKFARRLATDLDRELVVVHVDPAVRVVPTFIGEGVVITAGPPRRTLAEVEAEVRELELGDARVRLADGTVVEGVLDEAKREDAALIVCGSGHMSLAERIFASSVGSDLARLAERAVLVVPPA